MRISQALWVGSSWVGGGVASCGGTGSGAEEVGFDFVGVCFLLVNGGVDVETERPRTETGAEGVFVTVACEAID